MYERLLDEMHAVCARRGEAIRLVDLPAAPLESLRDDRTQQRVVVEHEDPDRVHAGTAVFRSAGSRTCTVVPSPTTLSIAMLPPCASAMRATSGRPRPVPSGLVV